MKKIFEILALARELVKLARAIVEKIRSKKQPPAI